jgi:hypothetical protein
MDTLLRRKSKHTFILGHTLILALDQCSCVLCAKWSLYSSVGKATDYWLEGPVSIPGFARFFSSPQLPDRL